MTTFRCIPTKRILELAIVAGHVNDMPFGDKKHITQSHEHQYLLFTLKICEELEKVNHDVMMLDMEQIITIAKEHGGYKEYDMMSEPSGNIDMMKMIYSQQRAVFFERFAGRIAAEIKGTPAKATNSVNVITGNIAPGAVITQIHN